MMKQRTFVECLRYNIEHNWNEGSLFESMTKDDCVKACDKIEQFEAEIKSQAHHIELLNQCDDSSTEVISKMDDEIEKYEKALRDISNAEDELKAQGVGYNITVDVIAKLALEDI